MDHMSVRWLVLETPVPEEQLVAALRLRQGPDKTGCIDALCAAGDVTVRQHVLRRLLLIAETVSFNLGLRKTIVQVPEWREDLEQLLKLLGYHQLSGSAWPQEKLHQLSKPTMLLDYHKALSSAPDYSTPASTPSTVDSTAVIQTEHFSIGEISAVKSDDPMERLMESLFTALHMEYGTSNDDDDGKRS